ncbi:hypothetical protein OG762_21915 [Streptomyces sp. NBC_01136]|uniref:hypothetical protein n=1 Tax=unclassified Streptomyces TaxID=2593676 RepID=UPI0032530179|nr:hypothetical protein OG762_21915 [Streptomyces sp. NBC_01136]
MQQLTTDEWLEPLRQRELIPADCLAAFVVGSAARGWNNARSDHDVYVVTTRAWDTSTSRPIPMPLNPPGVRSETFYEDGRRWEVTYWLDSQIDQLLAKVSWQEYERGLAGEALTPREEVSLGRIANCLTLLGEDWVEDRRKRLTDSAFKSFLVVRSLNLADDAVEDALGQMEAGNPESATISARRAFGYAVDALLESHGEFGSHMPKWRPNRLRIVAPSFLTFERYWALETMRSYDAADPGSWIREVLTLCQDISMRVETP